MCPDFSGNKSPTPSVLSISDKDVIAAMTRNDFEAEEARAEGFFIPSGFVVNRLIEQRFIGRDGRSLAPLLFEPSGTTKAILQVDELFRLSHAKGGALSGFSQDGIAVLSYDQPVPYAKGRFEFSAPLFSLLGYVANDKLLVWGQSASIAQRTVELAVTISDYPEDSTYFDDLISGIDDCPVAGAYLEYFDKTQGTNFMPKIEINV